MTASQRSQSPRRGVSHGVADRVDDGATNDLCTCCDPRNPLVHRPDFGVLQDGSAEFALCVLHEPDPTVYRNRGDGTYVQMREFRLSPAGEIIDGAGNVVARVAGDGFQRLTTIDDEDQPPRERPGGGSEPQGGAHRSYRPRALHVDLSQDDFYS